MNVICCQAGSRGGATSSDRNQRQQQETAEGDRGQDSVHFVVSWGQHPGRRDGYSVPRHVEDVVWRHRQEAESTINFDRFSR